MPIPIVCHVCGATIELPDILYKKKVKGRVVAVRCRHCGVKIRVDGTVSDESGTGQPRLVVGPIAAAATEQPDSIEPGAPAPPAAELARAAESAEQQPAAAEPDAGQPPEVRPALADESAEPQTPPAEPVARQPRQAATAPTADALEQQPAAAELAAEPLPQPEVARTAAAVEQQPAAPEPTAQQPAEAEMAPADAVEQQPAAAEPAAEQPPDAQPTATSESAERQPPVAEPGARQPAETPDTPSPSPGEATPAQAQATGADKPRVTRDLSAEVSMAGVFDDAPDVAPGQQVGKAPPKRPPPARRPPPPPRRARGSPLESQPDDALDFEVDFESLSALSAPLDLRAPDLSQLAAPAASEPPKTGGKWVLHPPLAALTTSAERRTASHTAGPLSGVAAAIAAPLPAAHARLARNWRPLGLVLLAAAVLFCGVWLVARSQLQDARDSDTAPSVGVVPLPSAPSPSPAEVRAGASESTPDQTARRSAQPGSQQAGAEAPERAAAKPAAAKAQPPAAQGAGTGQTTAAKAATEREKATGQPKAAQSGVAFDRRAAVAALRSAANQASACRRGSDPSGTATVIVTFSNSGRAINATVSGPPFAGTRTGGCIAATMRRAQVPPFSGKRVTVSKKVVIY
jgi:hypothetical protein